MTAKYASHELGHLYVLTVKSWGRATERLVIADSVRDAKQTYGWTRALHETRSVRRATPEDVERIQGDRPINVHMATQR